MKKIIFVMIMILAIFAASCTQQQKACTQEAKVCSDGTSVGRTGPNCEFAPCPIQPANQGNAQTEKPASVPPVEGKNVVVPCTDQDRAVKTCSKEKVPVCGWFEDFIKCIKYPCAATYTNKCEACMNPNVREYTDGNCPKEGDAAI